MESFFVSTPIYYVNARPHLGHAYTTIVADSVNRLHRLQRRDTFLLTGTDEHGDKIVEAAEKNGLAPKEYADKISSLFKEAWPWLEVETSAFIRTTDPEHIECVQRFLTTVYEKGDIYFGEYGGHYCFGCERFYTDKELKNGLCPDHLEKPRYLQEKNYFFRMTDYLPALKEHIRNNPDFIQPERYRNEVLGMLGDELTDLCISRPKSRLTWGIELPFDSDYVTYVWFDALINYISALGWPQGQPFKKYWPGAYHLVAKDILKPHAVFWPTMLMSAGGDLYRGLRVHGYWTVQEAKMSKSLGNVVQPMEMAEKYGLAPFRYFLLREMQFGLDASFSEEGLVNRLNSDLANDLGNLCSRTLAMTNKYFQGLVPEMSALADEDQEVVDAGLTALDEYVRLFGDFQFSRGLSVLWGFIGRLNKYVDESAPWVLYKEGQTKRLQNVMYVLLEGLRKIALHLWPVMPSSSEELLRQLGTGFDLHAVDLDREGEHWSGLKPGVKVAKKSNLFPRRDLVLQQDHPPKNAEKKQKESDKSSLEGQVSFEDFQKLHMVTGKVLQADKVQGADKLLKLEVDIGEEEPRTIVAGLARHFEPGDMQGRQVVVLANLTPRKIRGVMSHGMVLAVHQGEDMALLTSTKDTQPGSRVS